MYTEQFQLYIDAPMAVVFDYMTDQSTLQDWLPGLVSSEVIGGGSVRAGSKLIQVRRKGGGEMMSTVTVVAHARPATHAVQCDIMGVSTTFGFKLRADGFGTQMMLQATYSGSGLSKILMERLVAAMCKPCNQACVRNLRDVLEKPQRRAAEAVV